MNRLFTVILLTAGLVAATAPLGHLRAQEKEYLYEVGGSLGMSWGYGDVNQSKVVYQPTLAAGLIFRYNIDLRWALAFDGSAYGLKGDSHDMDYAVSADGLHYRYDRRFWHLGVRPECTFWNYGWGADYREKRRMAPFLTLGIGVGVAGGTVAHDGLTDPGDGTLTVAPASAHRRGGCLTFPLGLGLKWKASPRWNAQLTLLFTKCVGDRVDGLHDLTGIRSTGMMNNDWVGSLTLGVTFDFKERCIECHNQSGTPRR